MRRLTDPIFTTTVRILAVLGVASVILYVASRAIVPDGTLIISTDLHSPAPFVSEPKPSERMGDRVILDDKVSATPLLGDPVYIDLKPPSRFEKVDVAVTYANKGHGMVEIGALSSAIDGLYDMRPGQSLLLDGLNWSRVSSGKITLLDRYKTFASIDEFLRRPPPRDEIAVYHADADIPFRPAAYEPQEGLREMEISLRGSHRLYTYTSGETVTFRFIVQDMNRQEGADPVIVSIYRENGGSALARTVLDDDGNAADNQRSSSLREVAVSLADPQPGVYKIEFTSPADVFIRKIQTSQGKLVFADRLYLGDHVGYSDKVPSVAVYATGEKVVARTAHIESLQVIKVGDKEIDVREPHVRYPLSTGATPERPVRVLSPMRDVLLETDGVFALTIGESFEPRPYGISWYTDEAALKARGIRYILTTYEPPSRDEGLITTTASFDLSGLVLTDEGKYRFALSAPGIDQTQQPLSIVEVSFTLRREATGWREGFRRLFISSVADSERQVLPDGRSFGEQVP